MAHVGGGPLQGAPVRVARTYFLMTVRVGIVAVVVPDTGTARRKAQALVARQGRRLAKQRALAGTTRRGRAQVGTVRHVHGQVLERRAGAAGSNVRHVQARGLGLFVGSWIRRELV